MLKDMDAKWILEGRYMYTEEMMKEYSKDANMMLMGCERVMNAENTHFEDIVEYKLGYKIEKPWIQTNC